MKQAQCQPLWACKIPHTTSRSLEKRSTSHPVSSELWKRLLSDEREFALPRDDWGAPYHMCYKAISLVESRALLSTPRGAFFFPLLLSLFKAQETFVFFERLLFLHL